MGFYKNVRNTVVGFGRSLSGWEDSWYGGYERILWDYPDIKTDFKLKWENEKTGGLSWYTFNVLTKLFLLKVNEYGYVNSMTSEVITKDIKVYGQDVKRHTIVKGCVEKVLYSVTNKEVELKNLFAHYEKVISNTEFFYDERPQDENNSGNSPQGNQGKNKDSDTEPENSEKDPREKLNRMISETKVQKKTYGDYSFGYSDSDKKASFRMMQEGRECKFTKQEELDANRLVDLLDISFDPEKDVINSLRSGKLDTRKICEVPSGNFNVYNRMEEDQITRPFSVCMLMDESGSMAGAPMQAQVSVMKTLYKAFTSIMPPDRLYVYGHTSIDGVRIRVYHDKYNNSFEKTIDSSFSNAMGGTPCRFTIPEIYKKVRSFTQDSIIFLYTCDGLTSGDGLKKTVERMRRDGFVTIGVGIHSDVSRLYDYHTRIDDLKDMVRRISLLVNHVVKTEFQS